MSESKKDKGKNKTDMYLINRAKHDERRIADLQQNVMELIEKGKQADMEIAELRINMADAKSESRRKDHRIKELEEDVEALEARVRELSPSNTILDYLERTRK